MECVGEVVPQRTDQRRDQTAGEYRDGKAQVAALGALAP
jgi:hypothetical protein